MQPRFTTANVPTLDADELEVLNMAYAATVAANPTRCADDIAEQLVLAAHLRTREG